MSDPLSITAGVLGLLARSIQAVQIVQNYVSKYRIADLSIASTRTECSTIRIALLQIQDLLTRSKSTSQADTNDSFTAYALEEYEGVLSACSIAFSVLNERLTELTVQSFDKNNESNFKSKLKTLWNEDEMNMLRQNIRGQAIAINLLLSAFQAESSAKTYQLLKERKNRSILKTVSDDARSLLAKSHRARTIAGKDDLESSSSVIGDEVFDFDDLVINSAAYRRAYYSYTIRGRQTSDSKDKAEEKRETGDANIAPNLKASLETIPPNAMDFLAIRDEDYFDDKCHRLYQLVQQWVRRFSKFSDMRACWLTGELSSGKDDRIVDRLDSILLDGSDVDSLLIDRVKRRDLFMSLVMRMIWEYIFTRYLFGLDREQRQKLKSLEKVLEEGGSQSAVALWRAITLTLISKGAAFTKQRNRDITAVTHEIFQTLSSILTPPSNLETQLRNFLERVIGIAVDLSVEMRTQPTEYMMLPPLEPQYDANTDIPHSVYFNAALMNERSVATASNEDLEAQRAMVALVLFPLVVKKVPNDGYETVIFPAQVLVSGGLSNLVNRPRVSGALSDISSLGGSPEEIG